MSSHNRITRFADIADSDGKVHCRHGDEVFLKTSRTETNPERQFYSCNRPKRCGFFHWNDEIDYGGYDISTLHANSTPSSSQPLRTSIIRSPSKKNPMKRSPSPSPLPSPFSSSSTLADTQVGLGSQTRSRMTPGQQAPRHNWQNRSSDINASFASGSGLPSSQQTQVPSQSSDLDMGWDDAFPPTQDSSGSGLSLSDHELPMFVEEGRVVKKRRVSEDEEVVIGNDEGGNAMLLTPPMSSQRQGGNSAQARFSSSEPITRHTGNGLGSSQSIANKNADNTFRDRSDALRPSSQSQDTNAPGNTDLTQDTLIASIKALIPRAETMERLLRANQRSEQVKLKTIANQQGEIKQLQKKIDLQSQEITRLKVLLEAKDQQIAKSYDEKEKLRDTIRIREEAIGALNARRAL